MRIFKSVKVALLLAVLAFLPSGQLFAQARVTTKTYRMSDFTALTTRMVVATGNPLLDATLTEEIQKVWKVSPFDFCTFQEYEKSQSEPGYYFLVCTPNRVGKNGNALIMLRLEKSGLKESDDPMKKAFDIVDVPLCSADDFSGSEITLVTAMLEIVQNYASKCMESEFNAYRTLAQYNSNVFSMSGKTLYVPEAFVGPDALEYVSQYEDIRIVDEEEAENIFSSASDGAVVGFVIMVDEAQRGDVVYYMLIDASTHHLMYYQKDKVSFTGKVGLGKTDFRAITIRMKKKK